MKSFLHSFAERLYSKDPSIRKKLIYAGIDTPPVDFLQDILKKTIFASIISILGIFLLFFNNISFSLMTFDLIGIVLFVLIPLFVLPIIIYNYFMLYPTAVVFKRQKELDYEIVFAGRHLLIALRAGMPLFDALVGTTKGYGAVSEEISKVVDKVVVGVPLTQAIREVMQNTPSKYFNRVMMQVANAISSGADVSEALEAILDQISKEQLIALKEYNQKLTPVVMFYMVFGIIVPSLGVVLGTIIFSAISGGELGIPSEALGVVLVLIALVQFLFLGFVESSRPHYLL